MKRLENKYAVITGAAGGIGKAVAKEFLDEGAKVLLIDLSDDDLHKTADELNSDNVFYMAADVSQEVDVIKYSQSVKQLFGRLDVFFNNAGIEGEVKPISDHSTEMFDKIMAVNVKGVWLGIKHIAPFMDKGGSIINTSSVAGVMGMANQSAYVASKHAVTGISKTAALELADRNIRVNSIHPAPVENRMMRSVEKEINPYSSEEAKSSFEEMIPLNRYATNTEIAKLVVFLASDESSYITGTAIPIDGGMTTG